MGKIADLCRAIKGEKKGEDCIVDKSHQLFPKCEAIGGRLKEERCSIPDEKLNELAN